MMKKLTILADANGSGLAQKTVGELVAEDYSKAEVFKSYGIDFCCGGGRTVSEVCTKKGIPFQDLERALLQSGQREAASAALNFDEWDLGFLADYITNVHHRYVRANLPLMQEFTAKVARVHGKANPENVQIAALVEELVAELQQHMMKEEHILFPYVKQLEAASRDEAPMVSAPFGTVQNPIRMMEHEHDHAGTIMKEIRTLSNDYTPPEHACNTYRVAYYKLEEFEADLHKHIHLENNILFPKAITLEAMLLVEG